MPEIIARKIGLKPSRGFYVSTANGDIKVYHTVIAELKISNINPKEHPGNINPSIDKNYVLIGMGELKHLDVLKIDHTLTIKQ